MACFPRKAAPLLALLLMWPGTCFAHGVNLFCWAQKDTVQCRSRFSGGRSVHNGTWRVLDASTGDRLLSGTTNSEGRFAFSPPQQAREEHRDLKVVCEASMGHKDSWLVRAGDYITGLSEENGEAESTSAKTKTGGEVAAQSEAVREETIRRIVRQELAPVRRDLAGLRETGVGIRDVLGGLGYILGLFGVWALAASRRKSQ